MSNGFSSTSLLARCSTVPHRPVAPDVKRSGHRSRSSTLAPPRIEEAREALPAQACFQFAVTRPQITGHLQRQRHIRHIVFIHVATQPPSLRPAPDADRVFIEKANAFPVFEQLHQHILRAEKLRLRFRCEGLSQPVIRRDQFGEDPIRIDHHTAAHASPRLRRIRSRFRPHHAESTSCASAFASAAVKRLCRTAHSALRNAIESSRSRAGPADSGKEITTRRSAVKASRVEVMSAKCSTPASAERLENRAADAFFSPAAVSNRSRSLRAGGAGSSRGW